MREETAVDPIARLEEHRSINQGVENRLARDLVGAKAAFGIGDGQSQSWRVQEFSFDAHQEILELSAPFVGRDRFSHAGGMSNLRTSASGVIRNGNPGYAIAGAN